MIMIQQRLAPGVQYRRHAHLRLQPLLAELPQRLARRRKKHIEERPPVLTDQSVEDMRHREHQMEVRDGQERRRLLGQPVHRARPLALRAMPVATTVRHEVFAPALLTAEQLAAQRARPAQGQRAHGFALVRRQVQRGP